MQVTMFNRTANCLFLVCMQRFLTSFSERTSYLLSYLDKSFFHIKSW